MKDIIRKYLEITKWLASSLSLYSRWVVLLLVLVTIFDVVARYFFNSPTIWGYDTVCMLGGTVSMLGWNYVEQKDAHVRVDVFYDSMSDKGKALVNVLGSVFIGFPIILSYIFISFQWAINSWISKEVLMTSFWYPPSFPIRTMMFIGFLLFFLVFLNKFIRNLYFLIKGDRI